MKPLFHNYSHLAGKITLWDTSDNQFWYTKNTKDESTRQRLSELGFLDTQIEYQYNSHGFRTHEFDRQFDIVCFGCSFTMGTGIHARDSWPSQLETLTGLQVANLGHAGSSNDTAFRFAMHYLESLRPRYAVWLQTDMHRLELLDDFKNASLNILAGDTHNPCANDYFIKVWFSSASNQILNLQKNTQAFKYLCASLGITPIVLSRDQVPPHAPFPHGRARDLTHPGADVYKNLAHQVKDIIDQSL
jgi:hypothetical protein